MSIRIQRIARILAKYEYFLPHRVARRTFIGLPENAGPHQWRH